MKVTFCAVCCIKASTLPVFPEKSTVFSALHSYNVMSLLFELDSTGLK